jgi:hypothetical protein
MAADVAMPPGGCQWARHPGEGRDLRTRSLGCLHETPAFGVPTKYYFVGCPFAGVTAMRQRPLLTIRATSEPAPVGVTIR